LYIIMENIITKLKNLTHKQIIIIGVLLSVIGITLLSYNYINTKIEFAYDKMNLKLLANEQPEFLEEDISENIESGSPNSSSTNNTNEENINNTNTNTETKSNKSNSNTSYQSLYVGTLEVPRISLKKGFTDIGSKANTVNKNVTVIKGGNYPDIANGNFILAAHSGNSSVAYFKDLYKIQKNDLAVVTYKKVKYTYQVADIYLQPKTGKVAINRNTNKKTLTLITCTQNDNKNQTIYIAELIKEENL
jgi:LPXTG-site transpeptidase (sortase) family protein